jgi:hypothetical protein
MDLRNILSAAGRLCGGLTAGGNKSPAKPYCNRLKVNQTVRERTVFL